MSFISLLVRKAKTFFLYPPYTGGQIFRFLTVDVLKAIPRALSGTCFKVQWREAKRTKKKLNKSQPPLDLGSKTEASAVAQEAK
jgi:hypothetical protein